MGVITELLEYFFGSTTRNLPTMSNVAGHLLFGYSGAFIAFFLSCFGAYKVGTTMVEIVESDLWDFLDNYSVESADKFIEFMQDAGASEGMEDFLVYYAIDILLLGIATFIHMGFLITMGAISGWFLLAKL